MNPNIPPNLIGKFPMEQLERLYAPGPVTSAPTHNDSALQRVVIKTKDGRIFDLGRPTIPYLKWPNPLFHIRLRLYKFKRRHEFNGAASHG